MNSIRFHRIAVLFLLGFSNCSLNKNVVNVSQSPINISNQSIKVIDNTSGKDSKTQQVYNPIELTSNDRNSLFEWVRHENIPA